MERDLFEKLNCLNPFNDLNSHFHRTKSKHPTSLPNLSSAYLSNSLPSLPISPSQHLLTWPGLPQSLARPGPRPSSVPPVLSSCLPLPSALLSLYKAYASSGQPHFINHGQLLFLPAQHSFFL